MGIATNPSPPRPPPDVHHTLCALDLQCGRTLQRHPWRRLHSGTSSRLQSSGHLRSGPQGPLRRRGRVFRRPDPEQLIRENRALRDENDRLWRWVDSAVEFTAGKQQRFAATASAMGLSTTQVRVLLVLILGAVDGPLAIHDRAVGPGRRRGGRPGPRPGSIRDAEPWSWSAASTRSSSTAAPCWWASSRRA